MLGALAIVVFSSNAMASIPVGKYRCEESHTTVNLSSSNALGLELPVIETTSEKYRKAAIGQVYESPVRKAYSVGSDVYLYLGFDADGTIHDGQGHLCVKID